MSRTNSPICTGLIAVAVSLFGLVHAAGAQSFAMPLQGDTDRWRVVLDGVMGGLSSGEVETSDEGMLFSGSLRLENNGGFSQIRTPIEMGSLSGADGIEIEVRGDGRSYIFDLRVANIRMMAASYQSTFDTVDNQWTTIRLPMSGFRYYTFGRLVPAVGAIDSAMIESLGVTLADKQPGAFDLEIRAIRGYQEDEYDARLAKLSQELAPSPITIVLPERDEIDERTARITKLGALLASRASESAELGEVRANASLSGVEALCLLAIERGVPLFNNGQVEACAAVYEVALASIVTLGDLDRRERSEIVAALASGRHENARDRAWRYRGAIDGVLQYMDGWSDTHASRE